MCPVHYLSWWGKFNDPFEIFNNIYRFQMNSSFLALNCFHMFWYHMKDVNFKSSRDGTNPSQYSNLLTFLKLELTQRVRYLVYKNHKMSCNSLEFWTYRNHTTNNIYSLWLKHLRTNKVPVTSLYLPHPSYQALGKKKSWARARCWNSIIMKKILNLDQNMWACSFSNSSL